MHAYILINKFNLFSEIAQKKKKEFNIENFSGGKKKVFALENK